MFKFFQTKAGQNFMAKLYGIGASVVILGAMFKILIGLGRYHVNCWFNN